VDQARKLAATLVGAIAQGTDPAQVRQDRLHEPTFGDLTEQYLERHAPRKCSGRADRAMLHTNLLVFRTRKLTDLNRKPAGEAGWRSGEYLLGHGLPGTADLYIHDWDSRWRDALSRLAVLTDQKLREDIDVNKQGKPSGSTTRAGQ
jgi:hypothetical protein